MKSRPPFLSRLKEEEVARLLAFVPEPDSRRRFDIVRDRFDADRCRACPGGRPAEPHTAAEPFALGNTRPAAQSRADGDSDATAEPAGQPGPRVYSGSSRDPSRPDSGAGRHPDGSVAGTVSHTRAVSDAGSQGG